MMLYYNDPYAIFRLDWILIDSVIIVLLVILLILVKIYKASARWRTPFSNTTLEIRNYNSSVLDLKIKTAKIKNFSLISKKNKENGHNTKPTLILIRTNYRRKLLRILSEGLGSYNLDVILINLKIRHEQEHDPLNEKMQDETRSVISSIIAFFQNKQQRINSNYLVINCFNSTLSYKSVLSDDKNVGLIILNPTIDNINIRNLNQIIDNSDLKLKFYIIFSNKFLWFLNNHSFLKFIRIFDENILKFITLEKSRKSFKYYETILLGIIINILENT